ncbi:hypothetical protein EKO23_13730 [Nocardioides guangzhouensis]|uniref:HTH luxR-type domain-containing protein n=1 Tax=Nocardioides guangzhouensis TaxID=2497878 RepID=A0A4Q4ZCY5_9ACTN|nr:LuxR C-terminal-related transcriptional regulator [Nocardioides guangzhouensis]RYP85044.1 hypothetical protein EKO23_13730 [Nocardioides guangzhouensis]
MSVQSTGALGSTGAPRTLFGRSRLYSFFARVTTTPVSLLVAPAGCGKTAAVLAWEAAAGGEVRWFAPDQAEDAVRLAEQTVRSPGPRTLVLVVDDAHLLPDGTVTTLARLAHDADGTLSVLLVGRRGVAQPPFAMVLAGETQTAHFSDLAFADEEAAMLVRAHHPRADRAQVDAVVAESGGWAGSLVLGGLALADADAPTHNGATVPLPPVLDYLGSEVLGESQDGLHDVLVRVAGEGTVDLDAVQVLTGSESAGDLLDAAAGQGLLVARQPVPLGTIGPAWRFHPLLVELVRRTTTAGGHDRTAYVDAHRRAALHHLRTGDAARALHHAGRTADVDLQDSVIRTVAPELVTQGELSLLEDALASVPAGVRDSHPRLAASQALLLWALGRQEEAKAAADRALEHEPTGPGLDLHTIGAATERDLEVDLALLEIWAAKSGWRSRRGAAARAAAALRCTHESPDGEPAHDLVGVSALRCAWLMLELAGLQVWANELDAASAHVRAAATEAQRLDLPFLRTAVLAVRATLEMVHGAYQSAADDAEECLRDGAATAAGPRAVLVRGVARFYAADYPAAAEDLATVRAFAVESHDPIDAAYVALLDAGLGIAVGDLEGARRLLERDADLPAPLPAYVARHFALFRAGAAGFMGDLAAMEAEAAKMSRACHEADARLTRAIAQGLAGNEREAVRELDSLLSSRDLSAEDAVGSGLPRVTAAAAAVSRVAFLHRIGTPASTAQARRLLPDALARIAPQRLLTIAVVSGPMITDGFADLLVAEVERPGGHPLAAPLLDAVRRLRRPYPDQTPEGTHGPRPAAAAHAADRQPDDLTPREVEVLRALERGGSNTDIAVALYVSENTVKTHLASVYRKLGVTGRRAALRTAQDRNLL